MIHNIFKFSDEKVNNILIPLKDVFWVEDHSTIKQILPKLVKIISFNKLNKLKKLPKPICNKTKHDVEQEGTL